MWDSYQQSQRKVHNLEKHLQRLIQVDGVNFDEKTLKGLLSILEKYQEKSTDLESFESIFW